MAKNFAEKIANENNLLIVDALNLAFRWKHRGDLEFLVPYIMTVESLAKSYKAKKVIIACDKGHSTYRHDLYPEYKENRKELRKTQTEEEAEAFRLFFEEYENTLASIQDTTDFLLLRYQGVEADDIAAYLVTQKDKYNIDNIWLISSDKDWDLLVQEGVSRFSYVTRKETRQDNWNEIHKDVPQEHYISFKCLTGDAGDNIPGITQVGPKRALSLIDTYGSAMDIYDACPIDSHYKYIQNLNENAEQLLINYELMDIMSFCEDALGQETIEDINRLTLEYINGSI